VSTEDQARHGYSLPDQIAQCREKAKELGATTIVDCVDEGISGGILERPGLSKARQLIRDGGVSLFVCYDPDRLARKLAHQLVVTEEVEQSGCSLVFVNFDWKDTPEGRLFYSLRGAIAEFEKEKIKERTMRGLRQKAKQGGLTHDPRAFGYAYNKQTNNLDIVPEEAEVYKMMSRWFLNEQLGYSGIASRLTEMGIPTKRGARTWAATTVTRMLTNTLYKGELWIQRYDTAGKRTNRYRSPGEKIRPRERPKEHWVLVEVPAIIDEVTYQAHLKQSERISRLYKKRTFHGHYLMSGLLRCGLCGAAMSGTTTRKRRYYRCNARNRSNTTCSLDYFKAEKIESPVWKEVSKWLENPNELIASIKSQTTEPGHDLDLSVTERHLEEATKERARLIDLVQKGLASVDEVSDRMRELGNRISRLNDAMIGYKKQQPPLFIPSPGEIEILLRNIRGNAKHLDFDGKQKIIRDLVNEVIVTPNELVVVARIPQV
jgi:site-specific DNA recombinase